MRTNILARMLVILGIYFGLRYFGGYWGKLAIYPITQFVTFLHEFGHALGAIITGGEVLNLQVSQDGSGFTRTAGGSRAIVLMGGYLGSAILGNLLFFVGAKMEKFAEWVLYLVSAMMIFSGFFWFNSIYTTGLLSAFAVFLFVIAAKTNWDSEILMFLGLASILYIIEDFNVGPRSDLEKYAELLVFIPANVWMYIWLVVAVLLTGLNLRFIFRKGKVEEEVTGPYA